MKNKHQDISFKDNASEGFPASRLKRKFAKMKTSIVSFIVLALVIAEASSKYVDFKSCTSLKYAIPFKVAINPCQKEPCTLKRGAKASISVLFKPLEIITKGTLELYALHWPGLRFPLPVPNPNICQGYGARCPMLRNSRVTLSLRKTIPSFTPVGSYQLQAILKDQLNREIMCGTIDVNIGWSVKFHLEISSAIIGGIKD